MGPKSGPNGTDINLDRGNLDSLKCHRVRVCLQVSGSLLNSHSNDGVDLCFLTCVQGFEPENRIATGFMRRSA